MQCYVCFEPCKTRCCRCKDRYLHDHCRAAMRRHGFNRCPVCRERLHDSGRCFFILYILVWLWLSHSYAAEQHTP